MNLTQYATPTGLAIPQDITQEQWTELHRAIILAKKSAGKWLSESRKFGTDTYGLDYVAETEVQMELSLGINQEGKPQHPNAQDKSKAIVTIEGISQTFKMWQRKVKDDIDSWDRDKLTRALDLLTPFEVQIKQIRTKLSEV